MKNTIRCCISCILPCGALDVIRIVHANGRVEEISGTIRAAEIMKLHPKHVLKKPSSPSWSEEGTPMCPKIVILPPEAQLQRGKIYFLMPVPSSATQNKKKNGGSRSVSSKRKNRAAAAVVSNGNNAIINNKNSISSNVIVTDDRYLSEILSEEKLSTQRDRRRGRSGVWRPHLESIDETPIEA